VAKSAVLETWVAFTKELGDAVIQGDTAIVGVCRAGTAVLETWVAFAKALGDAVIQGDTAIAGGAVIQGDTVTVGVVIQGGTTVVVAIQGDATVVPSTKALGGAANWLTVLFIAVGGCSRSLTYSLAGIMASGDGVEPCWP